jgi:peptidoglycan/xylan/chitin deacetylase (PgdA/CDA1 family)
MLKHICKMALAALGSVIRPVRKAPATAILCYHRVNDTCTAEMAIPKADFCWQLDWLRAHARIVSLDQLLADAPDDDGSVDGGPPRPRVALTFDDGYRDFLEQAYPALLERAVPATVYIVPGAIDGQTSFWWDHAQPTDLLTWNDLRTLSRSPLITIGSHSLFHRDLDGLDTTEAIADLTAASDRMAAELGAPPRHFSYPRGRWTPALATWVSGRYVSAVAVSRGGLPGDGVGSHRHLRRVPIQRSDGRRLFAARIRGALWLEELLRSCIKRTASQPVV